MDTIPTENTTVEETGNQIYGRRSRSVKNHNMLVYAWAAQFLIVRYGYKMADLGCGRGDGALILSHFAQSIDLYDGHKGQLKLAGRHDYFCPTKLIKMNLEEESPQKDYDAIVCFETLEHLKNPERLVKDISTRCKLFIFSVPHNCPTHHRKNWQWHQVHKQIYKTKDDVLEMLGDNFDEVDIYYERHAIVQTEPFDSPDRYIGVCRQTNTIPA